MLAWLNAKTPQMSERELRNLMDIVILPAVRKTIKGLLLEFGLGQFFDSAFIRPLALGTMSRLLGPKFGLLVGKIVADVFFYAPSIIIFEMRKKMARKEAASLLSASGRDAGPDELANRVDAFAKSAVFGSVAHDDLEFFATMFDIRDLKDGEVLCHAGEKAHEVYVIKDGHVTIRPHDNAPVLARLGRSAVIGEYGMFTEAGRSATITADGSATVMTLDYDRFRRFMIAFPEGTIALLKAVVLRQVEANTRAPFAMTAK